MTLRRLLDFVLYVVIALVVIPIFVWVLIYTDPSEEVRHTWIPYVMNTALIFGFTVYCHRPFLRHAPFWGLIFGLLLLHTFLFLAVLRIVGYWQTVWWIAGVLPELVILHLVIGLLGSPNAAGPGKERKVDFAMNARLISFDVYMSGPGPGPMRGENPR
jgi:hypothetical protein